MFLCVTLGIWTLASTHLLKDHKHNLNHVPQISLIFHSLCLCVSQSHAKAPCKPGWRDGSRPVLLTSRAGLGHSSSAGSRRGGLQHISQPGSLRQPFGFWAGVERAAGLRWRDGTCLFWRAAELPGSTSRYPLDSRRVCIWSVFCFVAHPLSSAPLLPMSGTWCDCPGRLC